MKTRSLIVAAGAVTVLAATFAPAAHADDNDPTTVTFTLDQGALSVAVDGSGDVIDLTDGAPGDVSDAAIEGDLPTTTVTDTRNSTAGWDVSADASDFDNTGASTDVIADELVTISAGGTIEALLTSAASDPLAAVHASLAGLFTTSETTGADAGGVIGTLTDTGFDDLLGLLDLGGLLGNASHSVSFTPSVEITIPADIDPGTYSGTITQTVA
ncbi:MAG TPA: hypothetical protein VEA78_02130 [Acidimicrobiales bacterium]|nr:hypothetical protein [Acidimicrobiales bacterium]